MTKPVLNSELVDTFWGLAEGEDDKRVSAAVCMINVIKRNQIEDDVVCADLDYTLQRLVRGLASTRKWARLGYAMALTQVLMEFPAATPAQVIKHAKEQLQINEAEKSTENSNTVLGRVMVVLCIVESGALSKIETGDAEKLLKWLLKAKSQKTPLHHLCTLGIAQLISKATDNCFKEELLPLLEHLSDGWEGCTPDRLLLILKARQHHPKLIDKSFLKNHWNSPTLFCEVTWPHIGAVVIKSCTDHPIVHSVCYELLDQASQDPRVFTAFWTNVIDGIVMVKPGPKKYLCYQLVPQALKRAHTAEQVSMIMSSTLVHSLVKNLPSADKLLYSAAKALVQDLKKFVVECTEGDKQLAVLKALVAPPSSYRFDVISKSDTVISMERSLMSAGAKQWSKMLKAVVRGDTTSSLIPKVYQDLTAIRSWAISRLTNLIVIPSMAGNTEWKSDILHFLFTHGYFNVHRTCSVNGQTVSVCRTALDVDSQTNLQQAFSKALMKLATFKTDKSAVKDNSIYIRIVFDLIKFADGLLSLEDKVSLVKELDEEAREQWKGTVQKLEKIRSKEKEDSETGYSSGLQLLIMHLALQIFSEADGAIELLQDVFVCYDKAFEKKKGSSRKSESDEASWIEVITEVLLSLMSKQNTMIRTTANLVFSKMCTHMNKPALNLILDVFTEKKGDEDEAIGFEDDDMEVEEGEGDAEVSSEVNDSTSETDDDSEEESDGGGENASEDARLRELRAKLKAELGDAALPSDDDNEDDEKEPEDFDDEQMMKLDSQIASAFRMFSKDKKAAKEAELQLVHFRMRCIDLLQTYAQSGPPLMLAAELLLPLLEIMEFGSKSHITGVKEMGKKVTNVFNTLCRSKKLSEENLGINRLLEIFEELMQLSTKVASVPMAKNVGSACLLVMRPLVEKEGPDSSSKGKNTTTSKHTALVKMLKMGLEDFCTCRGSKHNPAFYHEMCERQPKLLWSLTGDLLKHAADSNVRVFCRTQVCAMLTSMMHNATIQAVGPVDWASFTKDFMQKFSKVLDELVEQKEYRPRFVQDVLLFLLKVLNMDASLKNKCAAQMSNSLQSLTGKVKAPNVTLCRKILKILGITCETNAKPSKRQKKRESEKPQNTENSVHDDSHEAEEAPIKKKKKKGKKSQRDEVEQNGKDDGGDDVEMETANTIQANADGNKSRDKKHKHKKAKKKANDTE